MARSRSVFPIIVAAPRYFAGAVPLGNLTQTAGAFAQVQGALSWFVNSYATVAQWMAVVERLTSFGEAMERAKELEAADKIRIIRRTAMRLQVSGLDLRLPNGKLLLDEASFTVRPGETVSVGGPSGSGKTTLFRALAGIVAVWQGRGKRARRLARAVPAAAAVSYRSARCATRSPIPIIPAPFDHETCREVLEACLLGHLSGRLDETDNWSLALSVGEQQRLAFARALLLKPNWIFIDEGTSALDPAMEAHLYGLLRKRLPGAAIVSIAHRPEVTGFHDRHFTIDPQRLALVEGTAERRLTPA